MKELENNVTLLNFVRSHPSCTLKQVTSHLRAEVGIDLDHSGFTTQTLYRLKSRVTEKIYGNPVESYQQIPSFLESFSTLNESSTCVLQLDSDGRFLRCFLCPGAAAAACANGGVLEILFTDGAFSKCKHYDGIHLLLVARDGDGNNLLLAVALAPIESSEHVTWFVRLCHKAGLPVCRWPIFSGRGHLVAASKVLLEKHGLSLNLKFCTEHIVRNVIHRFKVNAPEQQSLKNSMLAIQSAPTLDEYCYALDRLCNKFQFEGLRKYVVDIDPLNWCIFANRSTDCGYLLFRGQLIKDSQWCSTGIRSAPSLDHSSSTIDVEEYIEDAYLLKEGARPSPLFDIRDTNVVEGENFASMQNDARNSVPLVALQIYVSRMTAQFKARSDKAHARKVDSTLLTDLGKHSYSQEILLTGNLVVNPVSSEHSAADDAVTCSKISLRHQVSGSIFR
jgi:hypothetical protein